MSTGHWVPHESPSTVNLDMPPDQFIFQIDQKNGWQGDLAQDSQSTSEACSLWSMNEVRTLHVHPMVTFLYSSRISVVENHIGSSGRPFMLCYHFARSTRRWYFNCAESSSELVVDWAIPRTLPVGQGLTREDVEKVFADIENTGNLHFSLRDAKWLQTICLKSGLLVLS